MTSKVVPRNQGGNAPALSLIICTRNRAQALKRCLDALSTSELAAAEGELILVDNGSSDGTPAIMTRFADEAKCPVQIVTEPEAGLSRARNAGVTRSRGDTIVFTDDDCYLGDRYVQVASEVFKGASFSYCGGRVLLYDASDASYGLRQQDEFELIPPKSFIPAGLVQGANMVVHRRVFEDIGGFDTNLGAGTPFRCEDVDFIARASQAGFTGAHVPDLTVYHHHGRKPGDEVKALSAKNDYARGAYYAKFLRQGHTAYLLGWLQHSLFSRKDIRVTVPRFAREVKGALEYLQSKDHR